MLTDLRVATAYDGGQIEAMAGRSTAFDASGPGAAGTAQPLRIVVAVGPRSAGGAAVATVTVSNAQGQKATLAATLAQEAPPPGFTLPASPSSPIEPNVGSPSETTEPAPPPAPCGTGSRGCRGARGPIAR